MPLVICFTNPIVRYFSLLSKVQRKANNLCIQRQSQYTHSSSHSLSFLQEAMHLKWRLCFHSFWHFPDNTYLSVRDLKIKYFARLRTSFGNNGHSHIKTERWVSMPKLIPVVAPAKSSERLLGLCVKVLHKDTSRRVLETSQIDGF